MNISRILLEDRADELESRCESLLGQITTLEGRIEDMRNWIAAAQRELLFREPPNVTKAIEKIDDILGECEDWKGKAV